jgi:adenylyltransferase/sulfurtransferase
MITQIRDHEAEELLRYQRQVAFRGLGLAGQRSLLVGRALIVGVGGLGSWTAELLARAGVGFLRLADADRVDLTNLHRQGLYDETDARLSVPKVEAAAARLAWVNGAVRVEPVAARVGRENVEALIDDVDVVLDGTDNFATRFLLNDVAVKLRRPWIFAGVVGAEAQTMTIVPGRTPCLRCIMDEPPAPCQDPSCRSVGVLGPAASAVASFQAMEAVKVLAGRLADISPYLTKFDLWTGGLQRIDMAGARVPQCTCCVHGGFEFLEP